MLGGRGVLPGVVVSISVAGAANTVSQSVGRYLSGFAVYYCQSTYLAGGGYNHLTASVRSAYESGINSPDAGTGGPIAGGATNCQASGNDPPNIG